MAIRIAISSARLSNALLICPSCQSVAIGSVDLDPKSKPKYALSRPDRGALAIVTNAGRDAVDVAVSQRKHFARTNGTQADGEVVWSSRPDAGVQVDGDNSVGDGDNQARSPGRARRKPLKPLRREGRVSRRTCGLYPCAFLLHRGLRVRQAPGFPCALYSLRDMFLQKLGRIAPRER